MTDLPDIPAPEAKPAGKRPSLAEQAAQLRARVDGLPRERRWAVYALLALIAWLAADDLLWAPARAWSAESDRIEEALDRGSKRGDAVTSDLRRAIATFGPIEPPGPAATRREDLARAIDEVLRRNKVGGYSYETRFGQRVKESEGLGAVERLQAEVKFDIPADALPAIVSELESHPTIDAVAAMRLEKNEQSRKLTVQATIECWVTGGGDRRRR